MLKQISFLEHAQPKSKPCYCCGSDATTETSIWTLRLPLCDACENAIWIERDGLWILSCPAHDLRWPVDVQHVEWFRRINSKTGQKYKSAAKVKTTAGRRVSLLEWEVIDG